ncbi:hypothetical protein M422DRAFT_276544 [Sphaerobolus stellatus SS14]|uniref:CCHC-type domain-containing protein n=1 Tax=Sphaerobolus stellatus (strain SS14) TaxID=990650 RepID=A0A0C9UD31_SPHS4|nr:hypothetical protein M422DRAFT_276544 [Sphaerobolus stellatus SS14]
MTNWSNNYVNEESTNGQPKVDPELIQSTAQSNNRSSTKHALSKAWTELSAKTAILEWLYADQAPADHLNQAAMAARSTCMDIKDKDTDSETTIRNPWEGSIPFQHYERDILYMSNNENDNTLIRMVKYMLDQNNHTTKEKSPLAKAEVKVTPPDKYSREQSFEALETFVKGLLRWLDMHSMLGPDAYKYQVSFLGMRLEGKALEWFDKTVEPRKYQGTPMDLEQGVTGLYGQYIPSLARCEVSNKFDLIKHGTLSVQEFTTELELYFIDNLQPGLQSLLLCAEYDPEKKTIHKLYLKVVKLEDANCYDIGPRNNGPDRTKNCADPPKLGEINKGPSIAPGPSGVNRNSSTAPGRAGPPIHNRQWTNHKLSHNSIECYNCGKLGHIKPNCPEPIRARRVGAVHVEDSPEGQVNNADLDINDNIDDEHLDEDEYRNNEYDNQLDLSEDQHSWGSKPTEFDWSDDEQHH